MRNGSPFEVKFWGVRGSIPTPGAATRAIGGNTSCLEVRCGDDTVILDAGTGVRELGEKMIADGRQNATFLFSHVHWDHIMGFPFFRPAARENVEFVLFGERKGGAGIDEVLAYQAQQAHAPIVRAGQGSSLRFEALSGDEEFAVGSLRVRTARMNHPDGCIAFRIEHNGHAVVYATDTEHHADGNPDPNLVRLSQGADFLVYDSMYTADEYSGKIGGSKKGWGHSTWAEGIRVARDSGVKTFVLFHHDPSHDDAFVRTLERECREAFPESVAASEGMVLDAATGEVRVPRSGAPAKAAKTSARKASRPRKKVAKTLRARTLAKKPRAKKKSPKK